MPIFTIDANIGSNKNEILEYIHRHYILPIDFESSKTHYDYDNKCQPNMIFDRCWIQPKNDSILLMDRSPYFQKQVFLPIYKDLNIVTEDETQEIINIYEKNSQLWSPTGYIYLRTHPTKCLERLHIMHTMNTTHTTDNKLFSKTHIEKLHSLHELSYYWAATHNYPIVCIDIENKAIPDIAREIIQVLCMMGLSQLNGQYIYKTVEKTKPVSVSVNLSLSIADRLRESVKNAIIQRTQNEISFPKYRKLQRPKVIPQNDLTKEEI